MTKKKNTNPPNDDIKFEQALSELEDIVKAMEDGKLDLDDSLKYFERGTTLIQLCDAKLKESSKKIEILRKAGPKQADWNEYDKDI